MPRISQSDFSRLVQSYLVNLFLFGLALFLYDRSKYYTNFLIPQTREALVAIILCYVFLAIPLELALPANRRRIEGKGLIALRAITRWLRRGWYSLRHYPLDKSHVPTVTREEKTAILFLLVKFYYLPLMLNFLFGNWSNMAANWAKFDPLATIHMNMLGALFPFLGALFLFIDTVFFAFGYAVEYPALKNSVRSVEPTLLGWGIALICYPPFNGILDNYTTWAADTNAALSTLLGTYILQIAAILALALYLWPTLALGFRASNLTNRGIVTRGPYAWIRHPAYTGKLLGWWITSIPFLMQPNQFLLGFASMSVWTLIYFTRAMTEERHLSMDPDYQEYCKKVPWRFIPGLL
jgi:protein-S-isoprenylcysteine O-methyltransferase Ste14